MRGIRVIAAFIALAGIVVSGRAVASAAEAPNPEDIAELTARILPTAPTPEYVAGDGDNTLLATGLIDMNLVTDGFADPLSGLSLSFDTYGVKKVWIQPTDNKILVVEAVATPGKKQSAQFMKDWERSVKANDGDPTSLLAVPGARQADVRISEQLVRQVAFTANDTGFIVISMRTSPQEIMSYALNQATFASGAVDANTLPGAPGIQLNPLDNGASGNTFVRNWFLLSGVGLVLAVGYQLTQQDRRPLA